MNLYKVQITIKSALITPLHGDTFFGHICWGIRYHDGERALSDFLERYDENPPLIISNAFPKDMLPMPLLQPEKPLMRISLEELNMKKGLKKEKYVPASCFKDPDFVFNESSVFVAINTAAREKRALNSVIERMHNTINRLNGSTADEGGVFPVKENWNYEGETMDIYVRSIFPAEKVKQLFEQGLETGFGADKSTGKGVVEIVSVTEEKDFLTSGGRMMALGSFVNNDGKISNQRSDIYTKFGKLGGHFVHEMSPFKKAVIMFAEGATMDAAENMEYIGKLLHNIHHNKTIRHHAYTPLVYFNEGTK